MDMDVLYILLCLTLFLIAATFIGINAYFLFIHRKYSHLPSPKGAGFYFGHVPIIVARMKEGAFVMDTFKLWADECGPVYVFWSIHKPAVVAAHPEIIKELGNIKHPKPYTGALVWLWNRQRFLGNSLLTIQHHHEWKDRRRTYDPSFSRRLVTVDQEGLNNFFTNSSFGPSYVSFFCCPLPLYPSLLPPSSHISSLDNLIPQFNKVVNKYLIDHLRSVSDGKTVVDMKAVFSKMTLEVISWVAFGMDFFEDEYVKQLCGSQDLLAVLELSMEGGNLHIRNPLLPYIKPFGGYKYTNAAAKIREIGHYCIEKRIESLKKGEECPQDILTQMIAFTQSDKGTMNIEDLVDDFVTFYIAGQETTSNNLSFALIELLQTPALLQRLIVEINEVVGESATIEKNHLDKLEFMQSVIEETLRLHPTAPFFVKLAAEDIITNDYIIPKNTKILCSPHILHRDPEHFENPLQFDPSRFEAGQKRPSPYVYIPFGIGHRSCIGRTFAMMETKVAFALLFKNFELSLQEGHELKKILAITSKPANGIPCTVRTASTLGNAGQ